MKNSISLAIIVLSIYSLSIGNIFSLWQVFDEVTHGLILHPIISTLLLPLAMLTSLVLVLKNKKVFKEPRLQWTVIILFVFIFQLFVAGYSAGAGVIQLISSVIVISIMYRMYGKGVNVPTSKLLSKACIVLFTAITFTQLLYLSLPASSDCLGLRQYAITPLSSVLTSNTHYYTADSDFNALFEYAGTFSDRGEGELFIRTFDEDREPLFCYR